MSVSWVSTRACRRAFAPPGSRAGIKPSGNPDVGLLVCDAETPVSAARFTATGTPAAPVLVSRERCRLDALRAVLANSGCANAATGRRGLDDAAKTQGAAALAAGVDPAEVALASTGGISHHLPVDAVLKGILRGARAAAPRGRRATSSRRSRRPTRSRSAPTWRCELPSGTRAPERPVQGRGHDLAELRHDAVLRPDRRRARARDRRPAAGSVREALLRPRLASTGSSPPTTPRS